MPPVDRNNPKRSTASESDYSLMEFSREFPDDAVCLDWLWRQRLSPDGVHADCPKCGESRPFHRVKARPSYSCDYCGHHLHPTAGTIFHKSSTSLQLWFYAIFLMSQSRCGVAAKQLERELGVTYKTAWRMFRLIRFQLMDEGSPWPKLGRGGDPVEVDEAYIGGRVRGKRYQGRQVRYANKTPIIGIVERGGKLRAYVLPDARREAIMERIHTNVSAGSIIYTDEWSAYDRLYKSTFRHEQVLHGARIYVRGNVHTNTVENLFWLIKGGIRGTYHYVSQKYLQGYLNEFVFRSNHRNDETPMFKTMIERAAVS